MTNRKFDRQLQLNLKGFQSAIKQAVALCERETKKKLEGNITDGPQEIDVIVGADFNLPPDQWAYSAFTACGLEIWHWAPNGGYA